MSQATVEAATRGDYSSRQVLVAIAVDLLQTSIAENRFPCLKIINAVTEVLWDDECPSLLRKHHPEYLRATISFLMLPRTAEQRRRLSALGNSGSEGCTCDNGVEISPYLHIIAEEPFIGQRGDPPLTLLLGTLFNVVNSAYSSAFSLGWARAFKRVRLAVKHGDTHTWPASALDIAPHGLETSLWSPDTSLRSLCGWEGYCPDVLLISAVRHLVLSNAFRAIPSILLCDVLPKIFCTIVGRAFATLHDEADVAVRRSVLEIITEAAFLLVPVSSMHDRMISIICDRKWSQGALERVLRLLDSGTRALEEIVHRDRAHGTAQHRDLSIFRNTAICLWEALGRPADAPVDLGGHGALLQAPPSADPILGVAALAHYIWQDEVCANRVCRQTPISAGSPLRVCAGCAHTHYCSRSCQRTAWRDDIAPHRAVCAHLCVLGQSVRPSFNSKYLNVVDLPSLRQQIQEAKLEDAMLEQIIAHLLLVYSR